MARITTARRSTKTATPAPECPACAAGALLGAGFCPAHTPARSVSEWWADILAGFGHCAACDTARLIGLAVCDAHTPATPAPAVPSKADTHARLAGDLAHTADTLAARDASRQIGRTAPAANETPGQRSGASANYAALAALPTPTIDKTGKPRGVNPASMRTDTARLALAAFGREALNAPASLFYQRTEDGRSIPAFVAGCYRRSVARLAAGQNADLAGFTDGEARYVGQYGRADALAHMLAGPKPETATPAPVRQPRQNATHGAPDGQSAAPADRAGFHPLHSAMLAAGLTRHSFARYVWPDGKIVTLASEKAPGNVARSEATARQIGRRQRSA